MDSQAKSSIQLKRQIIALMNNFSLGSGPSEFLLMFIPQLSPVSLRQAALGKNNSHPSRNSKQANNKILKGVLPN